MELIDPAVAAFVKNRPWLVATCIPTNFNPNLAQSSNTVDWAVGLRSARSGVTLKLYFSVSLPLPDGFQPSVESVLTSLKRQSRLLRDSAGPEAFAASIGAPVGQFDAKFFWNLAQRHEAGLLNVLGDDDFKRLLGDIPDVLPPTAPPPAPPAAIAPPPPPPVPPAPPVAPASPGPAPLLDSDDPLAMRPPPPPPPPPAPPAPPAPVKPPPPPPSMWDL